MLEIALDTRESTHTMTNAHHVRTGHHLLAHSDTYELIQHFQHRFELLYRLYITPSRATHYASCSSIRFKSLPVRLFRLEEAERSEA
jgi:hypothetical protein